MRTAIVRLVQVFEVAKQSKPLTVAKTLETEINNFKKNLPVELFFAIIGRIYF